MFPEIACKPSLDSGFVQVAPSCISSESVIPMLSKRLRKLPHQRIAMYYQERHALHIDVSIEVLHR